MWDATVGLVTESLADRLRADWALGCSTFFSIHKARVSVPRAQEAVDLYRRLGHQVALYRALGTLCLGTYWLTAEIASARDALNEMRALEDPAWPVRLRCLRAVAEAAVAGAHGEFDTALDACSRSVSMCEQAGDSNRANGQWLSLVDTELRAGRVDDAVRHGLALEKRLKGARKQYLLAFARINLAAAWLAKDNVVEARAVAAMGLPLAAQAFAVHVWTDYLALLAALERRPRSAARLLGYGDAMHTAHDLVRQLNEARAAERAERLAREGLGDAEFDRLKAEGADLRDDDIAALGLDTQDS